MKVILPILACCVLASCAQPRYSKQWVPITDPLFKDIYGENAPTVESIFGGEEGLALLDKPDSVALFALRPMNDNDVPDQITTLGIFEAVGSGETLTLEDYRHLFEALQQPENYGDRFLGVTSADFGFKVVSGTNVLDIVFDLETPSVTVAWLQRHHDERRAASLGLIKAACEIAQSHLNPDQQLKRQIGRKCSNTTIDTYR
jgi:hypothetical protein